MTMPSMKLKARSRSPGVGGCFRWMTRVVASVGSMLTMARSEVRRGLLRMCSMLCMTALASTGSPLENVTSGPDVQCQGRSRDLPALGESRGGSRCCPDARRLVGDAGVDLRQLLERAVVGPGARIEVVREPVVQVDPEPQNAVGIGSPCVRGRRRGIPPPPLQALSTRDTPVTSATHPPDSARPFAAACRSSHGSPPVTSGVARVPPLSEG